MGKRSRKNSSYVQMFRKYPDVVSVIQICEMLDLSKTKVYAIIKSGELRRIPCGRIIKVTKNAVIEYAERESTGRCAQFVDNSPV